MKRVPGWYMLTKRLDMPNVIHLRFARTPQDVQRFHDETLLIEGESITTVVAA